MQEVNTNVEPDVLDLIEEYKIKSKIALDAFWSLNPQLDPAKITNWQFYAVLSHIGENVFKPDKTAPGYINYNNKASNLDYNNIPLLIGIVDFYIELCSLYDKLPTRLGFCKMSRIADDTLVQWEKEDDGALRPGSNGCGVGSSRSSIPKKLNANYEGFGVAKMADNQVIAGMGLLKNSPITRNRYYERETKQTVEVNNNYSLNMSPDQIAASLGSVKSAPKLPDND